MAAAGPRAAPALLLLLLAPLLAASGAGLPPGPAGPAAAPGRTLFVASEFAGIVPNGGIGTFYSALAESLAAQGHPVTLLYTQGTRSHSPGRAFEYWAEHYARKNITLVALPPHRPVGVGYHTGTAYQVYDWLRQQPRYDVAHFPDWQGHGYFALLAKHTGIDFLATKLVLMIHGPLRWARTSNGQPLDSLEDAEVDFLERESIRVADLLVSPSRYLLGWVRGQGWRTPAGADRALVFPYIMPPKAREVVAEVNAARRLQVASGEGPEEGGEVGAGVGGNAAAGGDLRTGGGVRELVFFGRLEVRKGVVLFCDAIDRLVGADAGDANGGEFPEMEGVRVSFLGSDRNKVGDVDGGEYVRRRMARWGGHAGAVMPGKNTAEALHYVVAPGEGRVAVLPSLQENSPLSILELVGARVPFLSSTAGGIPEMVAEADRGRMLFEAGSLDELVALLRRALRDGVTPSASAFDLAAVEAAWGAWHRSHSFAGPDPTTVETCVTPLVERTVAAAAAPAKLPAFGAVERRIAACVVLPAPGPKERPLKGLRATLASVRAQAERLTQVAGFPRAPQSAATSTSAGVFAEVAVVVPPGHGAGARRLLGELGLAGVGSLARVVEAAPSDGADVRNECLAATAGTHVLFADAGVVLEPFAGHLLATAVAHTDPAAVVAHATWYGGDPPEYGGPDEVHRFFAGLPARSRRLHVFLGGSPVLGAVKNCFGGPLVLFRRADLQALGGFKGARAHLGPGHEYWDLLGRLVLSGRALELVPLPLFWSPALPGVYRHKHHDPAVVPALQEFLKGVPRELHADVAGLSRPGLAALMATLGAVRTHSFGL